MAYIPPGFAHGFLVLSDAAEFLYKTTDYYAPAHERSILWNDPTVGIHWPDVGMSPLLAAKDQAAARLEVAEVFESLERVERPTCGDRPYIHNDIVFHHEEMIVEIDGRVAVPGHDAQLVTQAQRMLRLWCEA